MDWKRDNSYIEGKRTPNKKQEVAGDIYRPAYIGGYLLNVLMLNTITTVAILLAITSILSSLSTFHHALAQGNATQEVTSAANQTGEEMQSGMANTTQEAKSAGNQTGEEAQSAMNKTGEALENINPFT
jgi:hypothetical protein